MDIRKTKPPRLRYLAVKRLLKYRVLSLHDVAQRLINLDGKVILTGFPSDAYKALEKAGWTTRDWNHLSYAPGRTRKTGIKGPGALTRDLREERVWISPNCYVDLA